MGKNKPLPMKKGKKDTSVFKFAGAKVAKHKKNKPKPVTTNLKKLNAQNRNDTAAVDGAYGDVMDAMLTSQKKNQNKPQKEVKEEVKPLPDINSTIKDMEQL